MKNLKIDYKKEDNNFIISAYLDNIVKGEMSVKELPWDTGLLGFKCIRITGIYFKENNFDYEIAKQMVSYLLASDIIGFNLIMFRFPSIQMKLGQNLESLGFYQVENLLTFKFTLSEPIRPAFDALSGVTICLLNREDEKEINSVCEIAANEFKYSRYHMDPHIPFDKAANLKAQWTRNSCLGRATAVFVARYNSNIVGFILCNILTKCDSLISVIDLIGVDSRFANQGIGKALVGYLLTFSKEKGARYCLAGTQSHNLGSIRMYLKSGFMLDASELTFHYYKDNNQ
ncbi:MAG: GNAT family N-acetyltransferase [Candidatus Hydrogenedentota bacterium]